MAANAKCLLAHELKIAIELQLLDAHGVILEIVQLAQLVLDEVKGEDPVFQLVVHVHVVAIFAETAQNGQQNEQDWPGCQEDKMMEHPNDEIDVQL